MNANAPQGIARTLMVEADHLSRLAHGDGDHRLSARFAGLRTEFASIERRCGANPPQRVTNVEIDLAHEHVIAAVLAATGHEPQILLDRLTILANRLHPPRARTLMGMRVP
jgi:hypothetical protein